MTTSFGSLTADASIANLPGAGPVTLARLAERGLHTVGDLLMVLPRGWADLRRASSLRQLADTPAGEMVLVVARVLRVRLFPRRVLDVYLRDDAGAQVRARWFRPPAGMHKSFVVGAEVALAGPVRLDGDGVAELAQPKVVTEPLRAAGPLGLGVRPVYPRMKGIPGRTFERLCAGALDRLDDAMDVLPASLRDRLQLPGRATAFGALHRPEATLTVEALAALRAARSPAHRRLVTEELFVAQVATQALRASVAARAALACPGDPDRLLAALGGSLPFALTAAQTRAVREVASDLVRPHPMQRLLQGDVGSGKTVVLLAAALQVSWAGATTMIMAPTEVLAEQHLETFSAVAGRLGLRVASLTGGMAAGPAARVREQAARGEVDVLVGTHALLDVRLSVPRFGLAVVDEQHRFGVAHRAALRRLPNTGASGMMPHLLVLSATPIPRTLALTAYGDLALSRIDELPPGRRPVATEVGQGRAGRQAAYAELREELSGGGQAFVICPRVDGGAGEDEPADDETLPAQAQRSRGPAGAIARARALAAELHPRRVALIHGRMRPAAQNAALRDFRSGGTGVLVATTVVEVGVDVPAATLVVVENAERFGLAQLHQLRGRVGRGDRPGRCWLLTETEDDEALARLKLVARTRDGLRLAEADLQHRGSGDRLGIRQAGRPRWQAGELASCVDLIDPVRTEAAALLASDPGLTRPEHAALAQAVMRALDSDRLVAEEAG